MFELKNPLPQWILIISGILLPFFHGFSQVTWFPTGAKWYYEFGSFIGPGLTTLEVLEEDTIIDNLSFRKIISTTMVVVSTDSVRTYMDRLYVREENKVINGYHQFMGHQFLYDFNAAVGDTLGFVFGGGGPDPTIVDSIGEIELNGELLTFQDLWFPNIIPSITIDMRFVEVIGSINFHLFHWYTEFVNFDAPIYLFRCYEDENLGLFNINDHTDCAYIPGITAIEHHSLQPVHVYPNPATNVITVSGDASVTAYLIVDIAGKLQLSYIPRQHNDFDINISKLPYGMYFLVAKDKNGKTRFTEKFIK